MTTLHDRLADLADLADRGPTADLAPDLWDRAVRMHRRRRTGTVAIAALCCLLVAAIGFADWRASRAVVPPASSSQRLAIPDRIEAPSPWLPGTDGEGFGPLIAILGAPRGSWTGTEDGWVGVSAATGEYRFLDLEDAAQAEPMLSPDGRFAAYWLTGDTPGAPGDAGLDTGPVTGFAVYDLVAGETSMSKDVGARHGLMPAAMAWVDDESVAVVYSRLRAPDPKGGSSGRPEQAEVVETRTWESTPWSRTTRVDAGGGGWAVEWGRPTVVRSLVDAGREVRIFRESSIPPVVSPTGDNAAGLLTVPDRWGATRLTPAPLGIANLGSGPRSRFEPIPGDARYYSVSGWRDERTVLVRAGDRDTPHPRPVYAVDISTGQAERLIDMDAEAQFAQGLLHLPVVTRPPAPQPWDPRVKLTLFVLVVILGGAGAAAWRRRVRP